MTGAVLEAGWAVEEEAAADAAAAEDAAKRSATNAKATDTWHATAPPQTGATKLVSNVTTKDTLPEIVRIPRSSVTSAGKWVTWRGTVPRSLTTEAQPWSRCATT